jgi:hypothetical protein
MDYVTRQFIFLTKKFRRELPRLFDQLRRDLQEHISAIRSTKKSGEDKRDIEPIWLDKVFAKYDQAIRDRQSSDNRHYRVQNSSRWAMWFTFIATFLAFGAAAIYAGIAKDQLREAIAARNQTTQAIRIAKRSAEAAEQANAEAAEHFTQEERPYIHLNAGLQPAPGESDDPSHNGNFIIPIVDAKNPQQFRVAWTFHWKNYGKTPATGVRVSKRVEVGDHAFQKWYWVPPINIPGAVVPPNGDTYVTAESEPMSKDEIMPLFRMDGGIVLFGHIDYEGLDGKSYWTEFCIARLASRSVLNCVTHNLLMK